MKSKLFILLNHIIFEIYFETIRLELTDPPKAKDIEAKENNLGENSCVKMELVSFNVGK